MEDTIHIQRFGQGHTQIAGLHGWAGDAETFERLGAVLPPDLSILAPDLPGYRHTPPPFEWSIDSVAISIGEALAARFDGPFTLVGNCSGALAAMRIAQLMPDRVERLILIEPFAYLPLSFKIFLIPVLGRFFYWSAFGNPLGRWITEVALGDPDQKNNLGASFAVIPADTTLGWLDMLANMGEADDFADIDCPIDLVYGQRTMDVVLASIPIWQRVWPQARTFEIKGAGHLLLQEDPGQVLDLLR